MWTFIADSGNNTIYSIQLTATAAFRLFPASTSEKQSWSLNKLLPLGNFVAHDLESFVWEAAYSVTAHPHLSLGFRAHVWDPFCLRCVHIYYTSSSITSSIGLSLGFNCRAVCLLQSQPDWRSQRRPCCGGSPPRSHWCGQAQRAFRWSSLPSPPLPHGAQWPEESYSRARKPLP